MKTINRIIVPMLCVVFFASCSIFVDCKYPISNERTKLYIENHTASNVLIRSVFFHNEYRLRPGERMSFHSWSNENAGNWSSAFEDKFGAKTEVIFDDTLVVIHMVKSITPDYVGVLPERHSLYSSGSSVRICDTILSYFIDSADYAAAKRIEDDDDGLRWK